MLVDCRSLFKFQSLEFGIDSNQWILLLHVLVVLYPIKEPTVTNHHRLDGVRENLPRQTQNWSSPPSLFSAHTCTKHEVGIDSIVPRLVALVQIHGG